MKILRIDPSLYNVDNIYQMIRRIREIDRIIRELRELGIITGQGRCDHGKFELLRRAVKEHFHIPATNISPPMERLLYAISANQQPLNVLCIGIFCGNTLIWNVGAGCGPGKCYEPEHLMGIEIKEEYSKMARDNLERLGVLGQVKLLTEDGHDTIDRIDHRIDLLYLDAFGALPGTDGPETKKIYLNLLQRAYDKIPEGGLVLAHDVLLEGFTAQLGEYLDFVRDKRHFRESVCVAPDRVGIELSVR